MPVLPGLSRSLLLGALAMENEPPGTADSTFRLPCSPAKVRQAFLPVAGDALIKRAVSM